MNRESPKNLFNDLLNITVKEIGVFELITYDNQIDKNEKDKLKKFCINNGISYLPTKDKNCIFNTENDEFIAIDSICDNLKLKPTDKIFDDSTLDKLERGDSNEVRFIIQNNKIEGVIHIVDYNNEHIYLELYKALYRIENWVRKILIKDELNNSHFIEWIKDKAKKAENKKDTKFWIGKYSELESINIKERQKQEDKRKSVNQFQTFYLRDLLLFAQSENKILPEHKVDDISNLRNIIAHSKDITNVSKDDNNIIYNIDGLKDFTEKVKFTKKLYEYLEKVISNNN